MDFLLVTNSLLLGVGLAMDAFSVSIANAISENNMKKGRMCQMAGVYAFFQFAMPMIGWACVRLIASYFVAFQKFIPWIALFLLLYIGGKMIIESLQDKDEEVVKRITFPVILMQGVATSIDALSVGFTIADYDFLKAFASAVIIAIVTFVICMVGLLIGKKAGEKLSSRASIFGGIILILIGIEIFIKGVMF